MDLIIDLRDHENKSHHTALCEFQTQTTIKQLKGHIQSRFYIEPEMQEIFDENDRRIDLLTGLLENAGLRDNETLILKHSELLYWPTYKKCVDIAMKAGRERMVDAKQAVTLHTQLMESGLFNTYPSYNLFRMENHHKVASLTDANIQLMEEATQSHFRVQHIKRGADNELEFICRFEVRPRDLGGSRINTLAYVQLHGEKEETKYNVKSHHFGPTINSAKGRSPDIKEFFCYKLLELINVGPHAQFIFPNKSTGNKTAYIATKWNDNFVPISSIQKEEDVSVEVLVQILLLGTFLCIDDLHSENCGQWKGTKEAAIVDFMHNGHAALFRNVKRALLNNNPSVYWEAIHIDALEKCDEKARLEIAKEYLKKWDLLTKIDTASEQIKPEKDRMERQEICSIGFNSPSEELDLYISAVKQNLMKLTDMLEASE